MKYEKLIYGLSAVIVIAGALMKISHIPAGNPALLFGLVLASAFQAWHITQLKRKIEVLEKNKSSIV